MDEWWVAVLATAAALVSAATAAYTVVVQIRSRPKPYLVLVSAWVDHHGEVADVTAWVFRVVNIGSAPARNVQWSADVQMRNHESPSPASDLLSPGEGFDVVAKLADIEELATFPWDIRVTWREAPNFEKKRHKTFKGSPEGAEEHGGRY